MGYVINGFIWHFASYDVMRRERVCLAHRIVWFDASSTSLFGISHHMMWCVVSVLIKKYSHSWCEELWCIFILSFEVVLLFDGCCVRARIYLSCDTHCHRNLFSSWVGVGDLKMVFILTFPPPFPPLPLIPFPTQHSHIPHTFPHLSLSLLTSILMHHVGGHRTKPLFARLLHEYSM